MKYTDSKAAECQHFGFSFIQCIYTVNLISKDWELVALLLIRFFFTFSMIPETGCTSCYC